MSPTVRDLNPHLVDTRDEAAHQRDVVAWVRSLQGKYPALRPFCAVPNGGKRPRKTAAAMQAEGQEAGVPDLLLFTPSEDFAGLAIEMKRPAAPGVRKGTLSPAQSDWLHRLAGCGWQAVVCFGAREAKAVILEYLGLPDELINQ